MAASSGRPSLDATSWTPDYPVEAGSLGKTPIHRKKEIAACHRSYVSNDRPKWNCEPPRVS